MYADPKKYDELYERYLEDFNFIKEHAKQTTQPIIKLACGTGRLTVPMAKMGYRMIGVDIHEGMLKHAQDKADHEGVKIQFFCQDCSKLSIPFKSDMIYMTGNSFQHFLTNESQDNLFVSVARHLLPNGDFIFDIRNPILTELALGEDTSKQTINEKGQKVIERNVEVYDHLTQILHCTTHTEIIENESIVNSSTLSLSLRYTFPMELKRLMDSHGFELINLYGSWKKDQFEKNSISMVVHCRLRDS